MTPSDGLRGRLLVARADATAAGGTGHLMRTLALAQAWLDRGGRVRWLLATAPDVLATRITGEGIAIEHVTSRPGSAEDAAALRDALAADESAVGVVDGESFDSDYLTALRGGARRTLAIDDMARLASYPIGFVVNQNAHADRSAYPADAPARFLLGLRYVLLRREFGAVPSRTAPGVARNLLVSFGGADPTGMTARTLDALRLLPAAVRSDLDVRVIVGASNPDADAIEARIAAPDLGFRACVERSVTDMAPRIAWADLAIVSGGSTVWELARAGCPALVVETVPAEELLASGLARIGLFGRLGRATELDGQTLADGVAVAIGDAAWRAGMSALGMRLVDGQGAARVVEALAGENARDDADPTSDA